MGKVRYFGWFSCMQQRDPLGYSLKQCCSGCMQSRVHVIDRVLRWHFRQAVLANVRVAGELVFENDFPPGSDIAGCCNMPRTGLGSRLTPTLQLPLDFQGYHYALNH